MIYKQTGNGRWVTHLGFERGNAIVEAQQRYVGRPWSGWSRMVVQQLPQMPPPSINYIDTTHDWVSGRGEPGATVKVHVHGVVIRDVGVDGAGNWATHIGRQSGGRRIEVQQYKVGRPWSGWVGLEVSNIPLPIPTIEREEGVQASISNLYVIKALKGRGEPGASVFVHMPGVVAQWVGIDGAGNWSITLTRRKRQVPNVEIFQSKSGFPNSKTAIYSFNIGNGPVLIGTK